MQRLKGFSIVYGTMINKKAILRLSKIPAISLVE